MGPQRAVLETVTLRVIARNSRKRVIFSVKGMWACFDES